MKGKKMGVFDSVIQSGPTAEQGALRLKRSLDQAFQQAEAALVQVRDVIERHGADDIQAALGNDRAEVAQLYQALKSLIEQYKPGTAIPGLPSSGGPKQEF
jgi:hypothetical protein